MSTYWRPQHFESSPRASSPGVLPAPSPADTPWAEESTPSQPPRTPSNLSHFWAQSLLTLLSPSSGPGAGPRLLPWLSLTPCLPIRPASSALTSVLGLCTEAAASSLSSCERPVGGDARGRVCPPSEPRLLQAHLEPDSQAAPEMLCPGRPVEMYINPPKRRHTASRTPASSS